MVQLARQHNLLLHAHSDADAIERLFVQFPQARVLWAHAGFERPAQVRALLRKHRSLWADLAFRNDHGNGGQLLILDLNEHTFEKARELYADVWLGFKESALHAFLKKSGFAKVEVTAVAKETTEPHFETLLASGTKPAR